MITLTPHSRLCIRVTLFLLFIFSLKSFLSLTTVYSQNVAESTDTHQATAKVSGTDAYGTEAETLFGEADAEKMKKIKMNRHSFDSPLSKDLAPYGEFDWIFDKGSVPTKKHVVLVPSIANRYGHIWHKQPVHTNQFQLFFSFEFFKHSENASPAHGFALWFVNEPFQKVKDTLNENAMSTVFGYKANFDGLGVFFKTYDKNGEFKPSISMAFLDGMHTLDATKDIPTKVGIFYDFVNIATDEAAIFKLNVGSKGLSGHIRTTRTSWVECFNIPNVVVKPNGYVGFSGYSSPVVTQSPPGGIGIHSMLMYNLDLSMAGEDNPDVDNTLSDTDIGNLLNSHPDASNNLDITASLKQLSRLLYQQISDQASRESQILRTTRSLLLRFQNLEMAVAEIRDGLLANSNQNHSYALHSVHSELSGVKALLHNHAKEHSEELNSLHSRMNEKINKESHTRTELSELVKNAKILEDTIHSRHSISSFMIITLMVVVVLFGLYMWKRFRDMEKKHFL